MPGLARNIVTPFLHLLLIVISLKRVFKQLNERVSGLVVLAKQVAQQRQQGKGVLGLLSEPAVKARLVVLEPESQSLEAPQEAARFGQKA